MRLFRASYRSVAVGVLFGALVSGLPTILVDSVAVEDGKDGVQNSELSQLLVPSVDEEVTPSRKVLFHEKSLPSTRLPGSSSLSRRKDKGPENDYDTLVSLINATPYRWHKTYNNSYQLQDWDDEWPIYVTPGQSVTVRANNFGYGLLNRFDAAGEVTYALEGTKNPASFQVQYRSGRPHNVWVQFREKLQTLNNAEGTEHDLGFIRLPGGVGFVLAGKEGDFISNDGPIQWMQSQLPEIGNLSLREITLPRSHHAGLWKCGEAIGVAQPRNTQTHTISLFDQLGNGGIRVLDVRPVFRHHKFRESHGSFLGKTYNGMMGASVREMVDIFNDFTSKYPGEMFIWDIHEGDARNADKGYRRVNDDDLEELYRELERLKWRRAVSDDEDLTKQPLGKFINPGLVAKGESTVLVRLPSNWAQRKHFPGGAAGFVSGINFPLKTHWSETNDVSGMVQDQVASLREARGSRGEEMYNMDWILTQIGIQVAFPIDSIMELSGAAWASLYGGFWEALTDQMYPSMITMDDVHGNSHKAMAMTMNKCLAARKCGDLGGKVKSA